MTISLETDRLILRPWQDSDLICFSKMSQDAEVMRYFPNLLTISESHDLAHQIQFLIEKNGWGFWALELKENGEFIGFTGLHHQFTKFDFSPCTEIGWRLKRSAWGKGLAYEAAIACIEFAFSSLQLKVIVAFTAQKNIPSQKLMQRLGMSKIRNFYHPDIHNQSELKEHVLYSIKSKDFEVLTKTRFQQ